MIPTVKPKHYVILLLAWVLILMGAVLSTGGLWLIVLGGSWYYMLAGIGFLVSGILMTNNKLAGALIFVFVVAATVLWALWESGLNGWALVPRLIAPIILLIFVLMAVPRLESSWLDRTDSSLIKLKRLRLIGLAATAVTIVALGAAIAVSNKMEILHAVPDALLTFAFDSNAAAENHADWSNYGGGASAQRYSDLNQINTSNVSSLKKIWTYRTGELVSEKPDKFGAETTPIKIADTLYGCSGMNKLYALEPDTGKVKWEYDPHVDKKFIPYTAACRGVAYYRVPQTQASDACASRIFEGTLDGRIIVVDARTGELCEGFGEHGQVRITDGMGDVIPGMVSITGVPTIVHGVVVTGHQVQDGQYRWAPSGVIQGYDAITGALRFAWDMLREDRHGAPANGETYSRGTPNMWTTATGDEALGLVYLPMGNSGADYFSSTRSPQENKYSSALVALDVETGLPRWVFQTVKRDVWDYDLGSQPSLADFPTNSGSVPALILASKLGEIYVLDRRTGQPLTPVKQIAAPQGGVEPQQRAKYQQLSGYHTLRKRDLTEADMWGMSPIDQMICRIQFHRAHYQGVFTPPSADKRWIQYPGYNGGSDWGSLAVDSRRGIIIANYNDMPNYNILLPRSEAESRGIFPLGDPRFKASSGEDKGAQVGVPFADVVNAGWRLPVTGMLCKQPPYGGIRAIDLKSGTTLWDRPLGKATRNGPFGIPSMLPIDIGTPNNGGPVVTAGGLIFIAAATDDLIRAIDIKTGKTVWTDKLPAGGQATPMVYEQNGREYLVIMAGGHHFMETPAGDYLVAYALPQGK